ncbi:MAG: thioredoxin family protein [Planctomycetes bacterium]|nr:thioredoxin family protein [Planctomycetota bacterium]
MTFAFLAVLARAALLGVAAQAPTTQAPTKSSQETRVLVVTTDLGDEFHGKVAWFPGSYAQALVRARANESLVMLDFWADWCRPCRRMGKKTFSDDQVVAELCNVVCFSVDTQSKSGKVLAERFAIKKLPTYVWLSPDGALRDVVTGYLDPEPFRREVERIHDDRGTISDLWRRIQADTHDLDARWLLARKLRTVGDEKGAEQQMRAIAELDREGKSLPMRLAKLEDVLARSYDSFDERTHSYKVAELEQFLAGETYDQVLFEGWFAHGRMQGVHVGELRQVGAPKEELRTAALAQLATYREKVWPRRYAGREAYAANEIAWCHWQAADFIDEPAKRFALEVAKAAAEIEPDDAAILDTLACCHWMNGEFARARELVERCIQLEPKNPEWTARREAFAH